MASSVDWLRQARGSTIAKAIRNGLIGWILALWVSIITATQKLFDVLIKPLEGLATVAKSVLTTVLGEPVTIIPTGFNYTGDALQGFGLLAGPAAIAIYLVSMMIVIAYLRYEGTPDWITIPGVPDLPTDWAGVDEDEK